jgi:hypothetical protein
MNSRRSIPLAPRYCLKLTSPAGRRGLFISTYTHRTILADPRMWCYGRLPHQSQGAGSISEPAPGCSRGTPCHSYYIASLLCRSTTPAVVASSRA